jgi:PHD-finger
VVELDGMDSTGTTNSISFLDDDQTARVFSNLKASSNSKTAILPELSASTQEILARVHAVTARDTPFKDSPSAEAASQLAISPAPSETSLPMTSNSDMTPQFQRPMVASGIFDKSKLKSAFASALIPKSKTLPSQPLKDTTNQQNPTSTLLSAQNHASQTLGTLQSTATALDAESSRMKSDESTIEVMASPAKAATEAVESAGATQRLKLNLVKTETPRPKGRMNRTYELPSGEIVNSGKGLGRGRPGIKRGPRKPKETSSMLESTPISRKRKRSSGDSDAEHQRSSRSPSHDPSDSGDEYAPQATQTRSGRHTQRPTAFVLPESPSHKKPRLSSTAPPNNGKLPIKRKVYKGKEQSALCEHCLRGYGPLKNAIVFCDGCNRCWHQKCHDPIIPRKLVLDPNSEWFCNECTAIKEKAQKVGTKQRVEPAKTTAGIGQISTPLSNIDAARKEYFTSLTIDKLVDLLLEASTLAPDLEIWQSHPPPLAAGPPSATTQIPSTASAKEDAYPTPKNDLSDDEYEDEYADEHAKLYPKPGNGVQLPPESEDMAMLLEGPDCKTFSHSLSELRDRRTDEEV